MSDAPNGSPPTETMQAKPTAGTAATPTTPACSSVLAVGPAGQVRAGGFWRELSQIPLRWRLILWLAPFVLAAPALLMDSPATALVVWVGSGLALGLLPFYFAVAGPVRRRLAPWARIVLALLPIALTGMAWWLLTLGSAEERIIPPVILSSPSEVLGSFTTLWFEQRVLVHAGYSLARVAAGWAVAATLAMPLGILMAGLEPLRAAFNPLAAVGGYLPLYALLPLAMMWFAPLGAEMQKILFLAMGGFFYLLPLVVRALDAVPQILLHTASTLGATRWQAVWRVLVPVGIAGIYDAVRMSFSVGWAYIIVAEMMSAEQGTGGLGYLLMASLRRDMKEQMYLILVLILILAYLTDKFLGLVGRLLFPYKEAT